MWLSLLVFLSTLYSLLSASPVLAHLVGQPPFVKINTKFTEYYPVPSTSLEDFSLPQDSAPENYLVKQNINFEIDTSVISVPPEIVKQTKFAWDFGDGNQAEGTNVSHSYSKIGSFIVSLVAHSPDSTQPILLQTTMVNILPDKNYRLPQARLLVNGWEAKDPLIDIYKSDLKGSFEFDGSKSESFNSKITEYFWDFGDQATATQAKATHRYDPSRPPLYFPLLRVKTADGFIADAFVQISEGSPTLAETSTSSQSSSPVLLITVVLVGLVLLIGIVLLLLKKRH